MAKEDEIRLIAYSLWEQEGCIDGKDCEHWYQAELIWQETQNPKLTTAKKDEIKQGLEGKTKTMAARKKK